MIRLGVSYFGNRITSHAYDDLTRMSEFCDYVVHTVSETDLAFHKSVLTKIFSETRKLGLEAWADPWGVGGVFGGESFSKFLTDHRTAWQVMSDGRFVPSACLNQTPFRSYVKEWVLNVRDMGAQVIFWDEPHIAFDIDSEIEGVYACHCTQCQTLFKEKYGDKMPLKLDDASRSFRRQMVADFLKEIIHFSHKNGLRNALCLYAVRGLQDFDWLWDEAAQIKHLDILGCDPYWRWHFHRNVKDHVGDFARLTVEKAKQNGKESQIWIQAMRLPAGTEKEIETACRAAMEHKVSHLAAWSFDGGEVLDTVLSEKPADVRHALEKTFKKIRSEK